MHSTIRLFVLWLAGAQGHVACQQIALTFDDLPSHGPLPPGVSRVDIIRAIVQALQKAGAPRVYGFINGKLLQNSPQAAEVFRIWTAAGFPLGNHGWSHLDLQRNTVEAFERDIAANESILRTYMPDGGWQWFRYPYLHGGGTPQKARAVKNYLRTAGYRIAEVTLSFDDYAWNLPYARCTERNDTGRIEELKSSFLQAAERSLRSGSEMSRGIWRRDIKHVMLLHVGAFEAMMMPRFLDWLKVNRVRLITLDDAESDDAYREKPGLTIPPNGTLLDRMAQAMRLSGSPRPQEEFAKLENTCR